MQGRLALATQVEILSQLAQRSLQPVRQRTAVDIQGRVHERVVVEKALGQGRLVQHGRVVQVRPAVLIGRNRRQASPQQPRQLLQRIEAAGCFRNRNRSVCFRNRNRSVCFRNRNRSSRPAIGSEIVQPIHYGLQPIHYGFRRCLDTVGGRSAFLI